MEEFEHSSSSGGEDEEGGRLEREINEEQSQRSPELCATLVGPSSCRQPVILFSAITVRDLPGPLTTPLQGPFKLTFRMSGESVRVVRTILFTHGFSEVPISSTNFNLTWMGGVVKPHMIRQLRPHQKINHFPRCTELTRKDKLCENVRKMQHAKGSKHFNIIPTTFILPGDANRFLATYRKQRGTWIVKPSTLSRGRGISLINHPNQLPRNGEMVISKYIENPLCIDGFKFDLRLYVAVMSYDPLRIYLFEDGLTRFATVRYVGPSQQLDNRCMHLTNYSVNKHSTDYIACSDPNVEDYGNKWSLSALLRHLSGEGVNTTELMMRVEDVVIRTILCSHEQIASGCKLFMPHRGSCFELFGFDVLIDDTLRPWVLEVNLSPSLACDAPLDLRIKSNLIADLFSLAGVAIRDPVNGEIPKAARKGHTKRNHRQSSGSLMSREGLTPEEAAVVRETKEEYARRGGFVRIFPTADSWDLYGSFLDTKSSLNFVLHKHLYPESVRSPKPTIISLSTVIERRLQGFCDGFASDVRLHEQPTGLDPVQRSFLYTKKLTWYSKSKPLNSFTSAVSGVTRHRPGGSRKIGVGGVRRSSTSAISSHVTDPIDHVTDSVDHVTDPVDHVISNVSKLSKFQVRQIFASYLECVQKRLVRETNSLASIRTAIRAEDQSVDVVVKFLKRASANLRAPFTIIVPNHKLPLRERRRMLAKQLAEFVMLYRKETLEVAFNEDVASSRPVLSTEILKAFLHQASEEDLERTLGAYAKQTHSSTVFLDSATKPPLTTPTSSAPPPPTTTSTAESTKTRHARKMSAGSHVGRSEPTAATVGHRDISEKITKWNIPPHPAAPTRYAWIGDCASDDAPLLPQYSTDMLHASDLPLDSKRSLDMLTRSLQAVGRVSSAKQTSSRRMRTSSSRFSLHKRSLSVQSLASTTSSVDSDMSEMSGHRLHYPSGGSHYRTTSATSLSSQPGGRLKSASVIVSKDKPYVSPYAQSVLRPRQQKSKVKTNKDRIMPHPPLHPAGSVESIAHALNRLTQRQNARKYAARRPVVSALKAASQPSPVSAQPASLPGEKSREQENVTAVVEIDCDTFVTNSNNSNSNSRGYITPDPSYAHSYPSMMSANYDSNWKSDRHNVLTTFDNVQKDYRCFLNDTSSNQIVQNTHSNNFVATQDHSLHTATGKLSTESQFTPDTKNSYFHSSHINTYSPSTPQSGVSDSEGSAKRCHGTPMSFDLLRRIQEHNKAISHYMQVHRQHQSPTLSSDTPWSPPGRQQPTPSSSACQYRTSADVPTFKFVVPHPPVTPKPPNFSFRSHRGVTNSTSIS